LLLIQNMRSVRKARRLIAATETDALTGLYNRDYFFEYANRMFREHPEMPMDAVVVNIEQFHSVNELNGRDFGDEVLRVLGKEILAVARENGGIGGRFGADRFDIYCRRLENYRGVYKRLQQVLTDLAPNANIRIRMGVMPWQEKVEPVQLFDRARIACGMARGHYKDRLVVFDDQVREREIYEQRLLNDLSRALDEYQFEVYYQPKFDIQAEPPRLASAEALVRWRHPELGMIPPDEFIPLFEKNGQISLVDRYVWSEAARQVVRWREQYGITIPVSVNLSRVDVFDPKLEKTLDEILQVNQLDHDSLKLEVTESAYTENADQVIRVVESLRKKGYIVEMDDFGTGYSSLNMLSAMPIDVLKMDRAFVRNIEHSEKDIQLVALILDIARNLKVPVIAEGVETGKQVELLKELGCGLVQGYFFSRPLHASEFEAKYVRNARPDADPAQSESLKGD
ncbi:MAG: EAL domain-containing protein, partial [Oscillospiraceae bacterium]|nr:EAL domain-containing protein [Oscillospiraceae bacterium]